MKKVFAYGVVPVYRDGDNFEFLVIQHIAGHWGFPKGRPEADESHPETAQREFEEETGVTQHQLEPDVYFEEEYYPNVDGEVVHKIVRYYLCWVSDRAINPQEEEVQDYAWLEYRPARERITFSNNRKILKDLKKHLEETIE